MEEQLRLLGNMEVIVMESQESEEGDLGRQCGETTGAKGIGEKIPKEEPKDGVHCTNTPEGSRVAPRYTPQVVKEQQEL